VKKWPIPQWFRHPYRISSLSDWRQIQNSALGTSGQRTFSPERHSGYVFSQGTLKLFVIFCVFYFCVRCLPIHLGEYLRHTSRTSSSDVNIPTILKPSIDAAKLWHVGWISALRARRWGKINKLRGGRRRFYNCGSGGTTNNGLYNWQKYSLTNSHIKIDLKPIAIHDEN
jgi:hypothetical protein